jgi:hypothetical protein
MPIIKIREPLKGPIIRDGKIQFPRRCEEVFYFWYNFDDGFYTWNIEKADITDRRHEFRHRFPKRYGMDDLSVLYEDISMAFEKRWSESRTRIFCKPPTNLLIYYFSGEALRYRESISKDYLYKMLLKLKRGREAEDFKKKYESEISSN